MAWFDPGSYGLRMERKQMDSRILRTWFLKNEYLSETLDAPDRYKSIQERACNKSNGHSIDAKIFLVDTPFTFGHSQLAIKFPDDIPSQESIQFGQAASIIQKAFGDEIVAI